MNYLWIKALHVACVLMWTGGMLLVAVASAALHRSLHALLPYERKLGVALLAWDRWLTVPAMFGTWAFGIGLVSLGGWGGALWLSIKVGIVIVLAALHGILAAGLRRRLAQAERKPPAWVGFAPGLVAVCIATIALLVILKPGFPAHAIAGMAPS